MLVLLCKASPPWGPQKPAQNASGKDLGWACPELSPGVLREWYSPLSLWSSGLQLSGSPRGLGSSWPLVPGTALTHHVVPLQQRDPLPVSRPHRRHPPAVGEHGVSVEGDGAGGVRSGFTARGSRPWLGLGLLCSLV